MIVHGCQVLSVLLFMLVIMSIAVAVVVLVAVPQIRSGGQVLSDDGRQAMARAGQRARESTGAVAGGTRNLIHSARSGLPGGQRSAPADSGPIPEVDEQAGRTGRAGNPG